MTRSTRGFIAALGAVALAVGLILTAPYFNCGDFLGETCRADAQSKMFAGVVTAVVGAITLIWIMVEDSNARKAAADEDRLPGD